jgi:hypothetical protein
LRYLIPLRTCPEITLLPVDVCTACNNYNQEKNMKNMASVGRIIFQLLQYPKVKVFLLTEQALPSLKGFCTW